MKNSHEVEKLVKKYRKYFENSEFSAFPFFLHLKAMAYKMNNEEEKLLDALKTLYQLVQESDSLSTVGDNSGIFHNFAETVAEILELGITEEKISNKLQKEISKETLVQRAREKLEIALRKHPTYAKFYITLGRLYLVEGKYNEAIKAIQKGISLEDSSEKDYALRISEYNMYLLNAKIGLSLQKQTKNIKREIEKQKESLQKIVEEERIKNIEILSVFTALIGILLASVTFSISMKSSIEAGKTILIMGGTLLIFVLSSFFTLTPSYSKVPLPFRYMLAFIIAIILILLGLAIP